MFGLLDPDEPPPAIGLAGVLALLAALVTAVYEAVVILTLFPSHPVLLLPVLIVGAIKLVPPLLGTTLLCLAAVHFHQARWAFISALTLLPGLVVPVLMVAVR